MYKRDNFEKQKGLATVKKWFYDVEKGKNKMYYLKACRFPENKIFEIKIISALP